MGLATVSAAGGRMNRLYYGDNLDVLRGFDAASVDLIYLDPPFNSNASYNILFKSPAGQRRGCKYRGVRRHLDVGTDRRGRAARYRGWAPTSRCSRCSAAMERFIGKNAMMAYLAMMAVRLVELHRVLKPTGSACICTAIRLRATI